MARPVEDDGLAVGKEGLRAHLARPEVVVLRDDESFAARQRLVGIHYLLPDGGVDHVRPAVGAGDDDGLLLSDGAPRG